MHFFILTTFKLSTLIQFLFQSIVIVTDTWWVFCYSSDLTLQWQKQLLDFKDQFDNYYVKSMGALITSESVKKSDNGLVIVGGSYAHKEHLTEEEPVEESKEEG